MHLRSQSTAQWQLGAAFAPRYVERLSPAALRRNWARHKYVGALGLGQRQRCIKGVKMSQARQEIAWLVTVPQHHPTRLAAWLKFEARRPLRKE